MKRLKWILMGISFLIGLALISWAGATTGAFAATRAASALMFGMWQYWAGIGLMIIPMILERFSE